MARAMGRSVKTEQMCEIARMRRANPGAVSLTPSGELPMVPTRLVRAGRGGAGALEIVVLVLFAFGVSASVLHVVRPESAACASCSVGR